MSRFFLVFFLASASHLCLRAQVRDLSNQRSKILSPISSPQWLDSLTLIPSTVTVSDPKTGEKISPAHYKIENNRIRFDSTFIIHHSSFTIQFRVLPYNLTTPFARIDTSILKKNAGDALIGYAYDPFAEQSQPLLPNKGLNYNGNFTRGISFGNNQNLVLNSNFNLQMAGALGDLEVLAAITDNNIPVQPEGNTQQLREFDKIFIQLSKNKYKLIAGDYELQRPTGYFMNYFKKLQGATLSAPLPKFGKKSSSTSPSRIAPTLPPTQGMGGEVKTSIAIARGKFARNTPLAQEGNQGPYRLEGAEGERFIIVLAGTEKVWLDGQLMRRGLEDDYVVDYNAGHLTFTNRRLITKDSRIVIEFDYADQNFLRSLYAANVDYNLGKKARLYFNAYSEQDSRQPLDDDFSQSELETLRNAGDQTLDAVVSSIDTVEQFSAFRVLYRLTDTLVSGTIYPDVLIFSNNAQLAKYSAGFSFVGAGNGNYVLDTQTPANGRVYRWVAPDLVLGQFLGDHEPVRRLVAPKVQQLYTAGGEWTPDGKTSARAEVALSNFDQNRLSPADDGDNLGLAASAGVKRVFELSPRQSPPLPPHSPPLPPLEGGMPEPESGDEFNEKNDKKPKTPLEPQALAYPPRGGAGGVNGGAGGVNGGAGGVNGGAGGVNGGAGGVNGGAGGVNGGAGGVNGGAGGVNGGAGGVNGGAGGVNGGAGGVREGRWLLETEAAYEFTQQKFKELNPYRPAEFTRDWNVAQGANNVGITERQSSEHLGNAGFTLRSPSAGSLQYRFSGFFRDTTYTGTRHFAKYALQKNGYDLWAQSDWLSTSSTVERSQFLRPKINIAVPLLRDSTGNKFWRIGAYAERERNSRFLKKNTTLADSLLATSFFYDLLKIYFESPENERFNFKTNVLRRYDYAPDGSDFAASTRADEANVQGDWQQSRNSRLGWNLTYRQLHIRDTSLSQLDPSETYLGRLDYTLNLLRGVAQSATSYEIGSGQERKVEFTYLQVPPGEGTHQWLDRNGDGKVQFDEVEIAPFADVANAVRVTVFTDDFIRTNNVTLNQSLRLEPKAVWFNQKGMRKFLSKFSTQSSLQITRKVRQSEGVSPWNPFQLNVADTALVATRSTMYNSLFFNRSDPKYDLSLTTSDNQNKFVQTGGFESRRLREQSLKTRWNLTKSFSLQAAFTLGTDEQGSEQFESKRYRIRSVETKPQLTWQPSNSFRTGVTWRYERSKNTLGSQGENARTHDLKWEAAFNSSSSTAIRAEFSLVKIAFEGETNSAVGFAFLNGLQNGDNFLWNLTVDRQVGKNIRVGISYEGRKTGGGRPGVGIAHVGRAQVGAVF